jgi:hypothetical protein
VAYSLASENHRSRRRNSPRRRRFELPRVRLRSEIPEPSGGFYVKAAYRWGAAGSIARCVCGSYDTAIEHAEKVLQLSPLEPLVYHATFALALACLLAGRIEEAVAHGPQGD